MPSATSAIITNGEYTEFYLFIYLFDVPSELELLGTILWLQRVSCFYKPTKSWKDVWKMHPSEGVLAVVFELHSGSGNKLMLEVLSSHI